MTKPIPDDLRQQIWERSSQRESASAIAAALHLSPRTVRHLSRRFRSEGQPGPPRFDRCGRHSTPAFCALRDQVLDLRRQHPCWGAQRILAHFSRDGPAPGLPAPSTVRRWLKEAGLAPSPTRRACPAPSPAPRATGAHEIWQMDAAEQKALRSGQKICWLRLVDEASTAVLFTRVFAQPCWAKVASSAVQDALRDAFACWGRPHGLRVDNGRPWVVPDSDLPSDLELWLAGLAIATHKNRPHVPQDNPLVERSQRTAQAWAEPGQHDTVEQFQARVDEEDRIQREVYLFDGEHSRMEVYPELGWLGRPYAAGSWETICWEHLAALSPLSRVELLRRVDKDGKVSLYDQRHRLDNQYRGQLVKVTFSVFSQEWVFSQANQEVGRATATYLSAENICTLRVRRRPDRPAKRAEQRRAAKGEQP